MNRKLTIQQNYNSTVLTWYGHSYDIASTIRPQI